jgi:lysyl-tRNA synthetase class 2
MEQPENLYEQERRQKLQKLRELGVDPYGGRQADLQPLATIKALYQAEMGHDGGPQVKAAGRIVLKRDMGKLSFLTLRDETGDLQVALDKKRLDETAWQINALIDLGDQIVVGGPLGVTKKGEITVWATSLTMGSKSLLPPPAKWEGLSDVESRYRQRYVDLWSNPQVMQTMKLRMRIVAEIRKYLQERGFLEVETPMMQTLHGGAAARPFVTHHNALDLQLYMRIAPELFLKRLLVGGFSKVFELNRNFRNEGISPRHNPEFTMLEAYEAYGSWETMAELVEGMICHVAQTVFGTLKMVHRRDAEGAETKTINLEGDLTKPVGQRWRRVRMADLVEERTGWKFDKRPLQDAQPDLFRAMAVERIEDLRSTIVDSFGDEGGAIQAAEAIIGNDPLRSMLSEKFPELSAQAQGSKLVIEVIRKIAEKSAPDPSAMARLSSLSPAEQLQTVYEKLIEPTLIDPTYVTHVPSVIIPLARKNKDDPFFADVYELAINGQEISPGYTELNDPDIQAENFKHQVGDKEEQQKTDDDFLNALRYGMPPAGGMGLGIDRLVMMLTGAESIRDVILFPLMRPQA